MKTMLCMCLLLAPLIAFSNAVLPLPVKKDIENEFGNIFHKRGDLGMELLMENEDAGLTVPEVVRKYGYPIEVHHVTTADGYILEIHRIPHGKHDTPSEGRPVVWLQHGLLCDSSNWIMNDEHKALAYVLANMGYDVWMGNARGNTYSKRHVTLKPSDPIFWKFSWHEMGVYDIPAVFDYVLTRTNQSDLYYVGHSMGTAMFFVAMSEHPELNSKVRMMSALAPIAYLNHMGSPITVIAPFVNQIEWVLEFMGMNEFIPSGPLMDLLGRTACAANSPFQPICNNVLFLIAGYNIDQLNTTALPIILGHTPAGSSTKSVIHFAQEHNSGYFRQYDYGRRENLVVYGSEHPPEYNISKITVPVAVYWGENDLLADPADVHRIAEELPNVVRKYRIRHDRYNHLDFMWAIDNHVLLNNEIIKYIQKF